MDTFNIDQIEYGWFQAGVGEFTVMSSNVAECDTPRELLECAVRVFIENAPSGLVAWRGEPGAQIMRLSLDGMDARIEFWVSEEDAFTLGESQEALEAARGEEIGCDSVSAVELLDALVSGFALYENGNGRALYAAHWGDFPDAAYARLKAFALEISRRREAKNEDAGLFCGTFLQQAE